MNFQWMNGSSAWQDSNNYRNLRTTFVANQWQHIAVTRAGEDATIYLDGVAVDSLTVEADYYATSGATLTIGDSPCVTADPVAGMDNLLVYNRALTASEIADLAL